VLFIRSFHGGFIEDSKIGNNRDNLAIKATDDADALNRADFHNEINAAAKRTAKKAATGREDDRWMPMTRRELDV